MLRKLTALLALGAFLLTAQDLRFYTDCASFYDPEQSFVELYFMFPRAGMTRLEKDGEL